MSENTIEVTQDSFDAEVLKSDIPVLVDFWAPWCGPCKMLGPTMDEIAGEKEGSLKVCKINVDENQDIAVKFSVMSIPMMILFKGGEVAEQMVGNQPKANILSKIEPHLG